MTNIKHVSKIIRVQITGKCEDSGAECSFYRKNTRSKTGYKVYGSYEDAVAARKRQLKAYRHGLGPKVGSLIIAVDGAEKNLGYGYMTQVAKKISNLSDKQHQIFCDKISQLGFSTGDMAYCNMGRLGKKLVCIDFGCVSLG